MARWVKNGLSRGVDRRRVSAILRLPKGRFEASLPDLRNLHNAGKKIIQERVS